jgi:serine/threonine-protein kinase
MANRWVRIAAPMTMPGRPILLGITRAAPAAVRGFRPARRIAAPSYDYEIQQHEVTWSEIEPWLAQHGGDAGVTRPSAHPDAGTGYLHLPATGIPWEVAHQYCRSINALLPSEEEWEFAARGRERRAYAWGDQPLDPVRTHAFAGSSARVVEVMTSDQDQTPGGESSAIYDLMGNALEWTEDLYREDMPNQDESWVRRGDTTYRAVRGLPLATDPPPRLPTEGATYRDSLCATGSCPSSTATVLQYVGFRCVRRTR